MVIPNSLMRTKTIFRKNMPGDFKLRKTKDDVSFKKAYKLRIL
jgi:hypothetical protein